MHSIWLWLTRVRSRHAGLLALAGLVSSIAPAALAAPILLGAEPGDRVDLGGGLYGFSIALLPNDGLDSSIAINMTITGGIIQAPLNDSTAIQINGGPNIDLESEVVTGDLLDDTYDPMRDSYYDDQVFSQFNPPYGNGPVGGEPGSQTFSFSAGSGGGSMVPGDQAIPLAYVVLSADATYEAFVARGTEGFDLSGSLVVPEPSSLPLSAMGLAGLAALRRRRRG